MKMRTVLKKIMGIAIIISAFLFFVYYGIWIALIVSVKDLLRLICIGMITNIFTSLVNIVLKFFITLICTIILYASGFAFLFL